MICPRCELLLAGTSHHRDWPECVKALRGRLQIAETRRSAAHAEQQRERARRKAAQEKTIPSIVRRMERIEAEMRRVEQIATESRSRSDFAVAEARAKHGFSRPAAIRSERNASGDSWTQGSASDAA